MEPSRHDFVYSIDWVEFVFSSRETAKELLFPEHEAGNLTITDYEKAVNFLPRAKQYAYRPVGVFISLICLLIIFNLGGRPSSL